MKIHIGWLILYAWNPLVVKEIANGGHLDSIAVFFMMLSIFCLSKWMHREDRKSNGSLPALSGIALGFGFGAKLFPIVLFPALFITVARVGWPAAIKFGVFFLVAGGLAVSPMYYWIIQHEAARKAEIALAKEAAETMEIPTPKSNNGELGSTVIPIATEEKDETPTNKEGLTGFLSKWRMNDVVFSGIYLNLKPAKHESANPWYVFTPSKFRNWVQETCERRSFGGADPAFGLTRLLTLGAFAVFYLWQLLAIYGRPGELVPKGSKSAVQTSDAIELHRLVWILALFLFLQPTVNPWYWIWIAPLAVFSRNRGWLLVAGLLLIYYSRFWFSTIPMSFDIAGYVGVGLFDHGLAWLEFAAIFAVIIFFKAHKKAADQKWSTAQYQ